MVYVYLKGSRFYQQSCDTAHKERMSPLFFFSICEFQLTHASIVKVLYFTCWRKLYGAYNYPSFFFFVWIANSVFAVLTVKLCSLEIFLLMSGLASFFAEKDFCQCAAVTAMLLKLASLSWIRKPSISILITTISKN